MRITLWVLVALNVAAAAVGFRVSLSLGSSVRDVLQVLAGTSVLTAALLVYLLLARRIK